MSVTNTFRCKPSHTWSLHRTRLYIHFFEWGIIIHAFNCSHLYTLYMILRVCVCFLFALVLYFHQLYDCTCLEIIQIVFDYLQFSCVCKSGMERTRPALNNRTKYCAKPSIVKHCQILSSTNQKQQVYYQISDQPGEQKQNDHHDMIWIVSVSTIIISCTFNMTRVVLMVRKVVSLVSMVCMTLDLKVRADFIESQLYEKLTWWKVIRWQLALFEGRFCCVEARHQPWYSLRQPSMTRMIRMTRMIAIDGEWCRSWLSLAPRGALYLPTPPQIHHLTPNTHPLHWVHGSTHL